MSRPTILLVDDDADVLSAIHRDMRGHYREGFRIRRTTNPNDALELLSDLKQDGEAVAMIVSDQRMPEMDGVNFLEKAMRLHPQAKRLLLTAYSDTEAAIKAINDIDLDYYLLKPWDPPDEKLYPVVDELLDDWENSYRPEFRGLSLIGYQWSPQSHDLKDFLARNLVPYRWFNVETPEGKARQEESSIEETQLPVVVLESGNVLSKPTTSEVGAELKLGTTPSDELYDVTIIGAGPAGLAAAVYGASEGLRTSLLERRAPGGQAGTSSRIENYLGFPQGLSGSELSRRAVAQATRLGAELMVPQRVEKIETEADVKTLTLEGGQTLRSRAVVISTGVDYRRLPAEGVDDFTGAGVYYGAAAVEAAACSNQTVYVVGGGNSAGQAAMYLSKFASDVHIIIRKPDLSSSMSAYLVDQIAQTPSITVEGRRQVVGAAGNEGHLASLSIKNLDDETVEERDAYALYIFIGSRPVTEWLGDTLMVDKRGYILTGLDLQRQESFRKAWKLDRSPLGLESCMPGVFAAGDVRSGAMNRVASAVGEGAMSIKLVHEYLTTV